MVMFCATSFSGVSQNNNRFQYLDDDLGSMATSIHMMQDSYGYIWASTLSGLTRYDGESYVHYVKSDSIDGLPEVFAYCSFEDKYNNIWIALYDYGLAILDRDANTFKWIKSDTLNPNGLHLSKIKTIAKDNNGNIYFLGEDGIQRVKLKTESYADLIFEFQKDFLPTIKEEIVGFSLLNDNKGKFWIGGRKAFYTIDSSGKGERASDAVDDLSVITQSILEDSKGDIYIVRGGQPLLKYDSVSNSYEKDEKVIYPNLNMLSIVDADDHLWTFIRPGKVLKYDLHNKSLTKFSSFDLPFNIYGSYFRSPFVSKEGTLWLAGAGNFPFQHQPKTHKEISPVLYDKTKMESSSCVYVDENNVYIGQLLDGIKIINKVDGSIRKLTKENSLLFDNRIYQIIEVDKNRLVILGRSGVYVYDKLVQKITKAKRFNSLIRCGYYAGKDIMWVSGETRRIFKLDLNDMSATSIFDSNDNLPETHTVTQIVEDRDGTIWIGGRYQGLYHYDPKSEECNIYSQDAIDPKYKLNTSMIEALHIDDDGDVWIGGRSGINIINRKSETIKSIGFADGLRHVHICDIIQDDNWNYWVMTDQDISRIDKKSKKITTYDSKDGFMNGQYYYRSFGMYDGQIYAAGNIGVDRFNPSEMKINPEPPQLILSEINVMGKPYQSDISIEKLDKIYVDHNENFIDLKVLPLHFVAPDKNEISYKIEESHQEYINIGNRRSISLSGLGPGTHTVFVKGSNSDGVWSESKKISIEVAYPWWRTWVFYLGTILMFGIITWLLLKWYLDKERKKQEENKRITSQMAELELKALSSQMNPHFLFNSLNSVKSLINQNKNKEASSYITRYSKLVRQILNNSRSKFVRLQDEIDVIELYLDLEKMRLGNSFLYVINIEDGVGADFIEVPPSILQPYVENSIWHGLMNKETGDKHLSISIGKKEDFIEIRIIDNGIGRKAAKLIQSDSVLKKKSLGTLISKERINLLSDVYGYESSVEIIDLKDEDGNASGTEVKILLQIDE